MAKKKAAELVEIWLREFEKADSYELHRVEFVKEGTDWVLRVFVDKREGDGYGLMSTDDCELVSRYLSEKLDEADPIPQNYILEVSSPGMDRPLITDKDFLRFRGEQVDVKLYEAVEGSKLLSGVLAGREEDGTVVITGQGNREYRLEASRIAKITLAVVF